MATSHADRICKALIRHGRKASTPAALIHKGTFPGQKVIQATLATLPADMASQGLGAPGLIVVGGVAGLRSKLRWFEDKPLFGRRIVVTRAREQASRLAQGLEERGAEVFEAPSISIKALAVSRASIEKILSCRWLIVTSTNGADLLAENLFKAGLDARALHKVKIAAIGASTAAALRAHGLKADLVPAGFVAEELARALLKREGKKIGGASIVLARALEGRDALLKLLKNAGAKVADLPLYKTVADQSHASTMSRAVLASKVDWVTFTSSSTVKLFMDQLSEDARAAARDRMLALCMGPITAEAAREAGFHVALVSKKALIPDFLDSIEAYARATR